MSVDITVHETLSVNIVRELISSRIDCGSTSVDAAFENFLGEIFGKAVIASLKNHHKEDFGDLFRDFEVKKHVYNKEGKTTFRIPSIINYLLESKSGTSMRKCVEKSIYKNFVSVSVDRLKIDAQVMRSFSENVVTIIIRHVEALLKNPITSNCSAIVMVGEFSKSVVLQECIQEKLGELKVVIPEDPDLACLRGSVIIGHNPFALVVERTGHSIQATCATLPSYKMNRRPRGWCIILNIETGVNQPVREGTLYDKARLKEVFQDKLHFLVQCHDNPTSIDMMRCLVDISHNNDHAAFDCFVCCILSHGDLGHVFGSDGRAVPIKDLTSVFNAYRCPSLGGKPKLFFIQACQGNTLMTGVTVATDIQKDACREETIPLEADFLFGYATVPGYISYRGTQSGSWYMRALCHALTEYHDRCHLLEILTAVNRMVAQESDEVRGGVYKQIPAPQSTLTKLLYFR